MNIYHFRANGRPVIVRILVTGVKFEYRMVRKVHRNVFSCQKMQYEPDSIHLVKQFVTSSVPWRPSWIFFVRASCGPRKSRRKLLWVSVGPRLPSCKFSETCPQTPIRTYSDKFLSSYVAFVALLDVVREFFPPHGGHTAFSSWKAWKHLLVFFIFVDWADRRGPAGEFIV